MSLFRMLGGSQEGSIRAYKIAGVDSGEIS
jgi:hypothetical protein